ncbi:hypothetical protein E4U13_003054 [Claviceps humidiphila]|uniref:Uncharacterized protein n=1 Tax=Claviceps humidiphila TaxID=1294629 RepID=A0A9P7Q0S4_9HYPO|nr:hypothetical protein E4U13_003054 [Claviceps humidiphila]
MSLTIYGKEAQLSMQIRYDFIEVSRRTQSPKDRRTRVLFKFGGSISPAVIAGHPIYYPSRKWGNYEVLKKDLGITPGGCLGEFTRVRGKV